MQTRRDFLVSAASALSVSTIGGKAYAEPGTRMVDAAKKEGEIVWYTGIVVNQLVRPLAEGFEKRYGIKVRYVSTTEADTVLRLQSEARAQKYIGDLFDSSGAVFPTLRSADLIGQYTPRNAERFPADLKDKDGYFTAVYSLYLTTGYNTNLVQEADAPKSYEDLLHPKWVGKMAWSDTRALSGPAGFTANVLRAMGEDDGIEYLKKLAKQKITSIPANQRVVLDQVIAGQYSIGLEIYNHHTYISRAKGAPVKAAGTEPYVGHLGAIFIAKNAPHPNAARLFVEYLCSTEGQRLVRDAGYPPADPQIPPKEPGTSPVTAGFEYTMLTPYDAGAPLEKWLEIYDNIFRT